MKKIILLLLFVITIITNVRSQSGVTSYPLPAGIDYTQQDLKIDAFGNKWVAFKRMGIWKFDGTTWTVYDTLNSNIPSDQINGIAFDPSNNIWVATRKGLAKFDGAVWTTYNVLNSGLPDDSVSCVYADNTDIWAGTRNGLAKFNGSSWTIYNTSTSGLTNNRIQCIAKESAGDFWIGTKGGLFKKSGSTWSNFNSTNPYLISTYNIISIYIDQSNGKWCGILGTAGNGIYKVIGNNLIPINKLFQNYNLLSQNIKSLTEGPHSGVAFCDAGNLIEISGDQVYKYDSVGGFHNLYEPSSGLIWYLKYSWPSSFLCSFDTSAYVGTTLISPLQDIANLNINMVDAPIYIQLSYLTYNFWGYCVPKNSGRMNMSSSNISIGGIDNSGALHESNMPYELGDSRLGPLDTISGTTDSITSANYNRIWKVDRYKIEEFKYNFGLGNVASGSYTVDNSILSWPAIGTGNITRKLAPFIDVNHDGIYNPITDGDYPDIKGDEMCYTIYNDNIVPHNSGGIPLKVEIHESSYAFVCSEIVDSLKVLNYTTFYNYQIFNRSTENYHDTYLGLFQDDDIGSGTDDFVDCTPFSNYGSCYNGDLVDDNPPAGVVPYGQKPPMLSTVILNGPLAETGDGIDNNNNGTIDEVGEKNLMTHFLYYNNDGTPTGNPSTPAEMYNYMKSIWKDSTHVTYGGNGHLGVTPTNFMFDGTPADSSGWCEESCGNVPADRRFLMSCGPFNLNAGENVSFDYAIVYTRDTADSYSIENLYQKNKKDVKQIQQWFAVDSFPSCLVLSFETPTSVKANNGTLGVYPNPSSDNITIDYSSTSKNYNLKIYSSTGVLIKKIDETTTTSISIADLKNGLYLLNLQDGNNSVTKRFVKQSH